VVVKNLVVFFGGTQTTEKRKCCCLLWSYSEIKQTFVAFFARLTQKTKNVVALFSDITQQSQKLCQAFSNQYSKNVVVECVQSYIVAKDEGMTSIWTFLKAC
jgi:beta-lactamase regulating signal transducer with metallopeptidase domain